MRDYIWFIGFKTFWFFTHPQVRLFQVLRRYVVRHKKKKERPEPDSNRSSHNIPKRIWIYWAQGWEDAPPIVQVCRDSWIKCNKDWEVVLLTEKNLSDYIALDVLEDRQIPYVWRADVIRLYLLEKYGGVWADATTFCTMPLDGWLPGVTRTGFFAFDKPKTTLASWFLVAEEHNSLMREWKKYADWYWKYTHEGKRYWIFFTFEYLLFLNKKIQNIWYNTAYISSSGAYVVQNLLKQKPVDVRESIQSLSREVSPVHKLNWKIEIPAVFLENIEK